MNKKILSFIAVAVLVLGMTSLTYAKSNLNTVNKVNSQTYESAMTKSSVINSESKKDLNKEMIDLMKENGFKDITDDIEDGNYDFMDEFMNNMTDEEYQKMIDSMTEVHPKMGSMMKNIDKEDMIKMHNSCHGYRGEISN